MALMLLCAAPCLAADPADDQAAVAAIVPGSIIRKPWGWTISSKAGNTHVMRSSDGYTVTTPRETFHLIRAGDGFTITPGRKGGRVLSPDDAYDILAKRRR